MSPRVGVTLSGRYRLQRLIATGGMAEVIAKETQVVNYIAPWLTLDGLRIIWELNQ